MEQRKSHIKLDLVTKIIVLCFLFFSGNIASNAQDSIVNYRHNFGVFPVYEGVVFKYEHKLNTHRNRSLRYAVTLKGHNNISFLFPMEEYNEQKIAIQFRNYIAKKTSFKGFYHGSCLQYKHFDGEGSFNSFGRFKPASYNIQSFGMGYTIGAQRMTKSGFNYEIGWAVYYQFIKGKTFGDSYINYDIPYNPYRSAFNSQMTFGIGMAIK
jgi:hypothetical protein